MLWPMPLASATGAAGKRTSKLDTIRLNGRLQSSQVLFWSDVINGLAAAPIMIAMMMIVSDKKQMKEFSAPAVMRFSAGMRLESWRSPPLPCSYSNHEKLLLNRLLAFGRFTEVLAQLILRAGQRCKPGSGELFACTIDVEIQHRHR